MLRAYCLGALSSEHLKPVDPGERDDGSEGNDIASNSDANRLQDELQNLKRAANATGVPSMVAKMYDGELQHHPSWIASHPDSVCSLVKSAEAHRSEDTEITNIVVGDTVLEFRFSERSFCLPDGEWATHSDLEV